MSHNGFTQIPCQLFLKHKVSEISLADVAIFTVVLNLRLGQKDHLFKAVDQFIAFYYGAQKFCEQLSSQQ